MKITSRDNSLLRQARATRDGKLDDSIFIEGLRLAEEAVLSGLNISTVIVSEELAKKEKAAELLKKFEGTTTRLAFVSEKLLESVSFTKTPQGIVVLAKRPDASSKRFSSAQKDLSLIVIMHRINNPVNVGAILRTVEAAGGSGVIATVETSDPFSPKSLRGAMGSAFRLPIWVGTTYEEAVAWCREQKIQLVCASVEGPTSYLEVDWRRPSAIVMGTESTGLSPEEIALADKEVRIPMRGTAESLNVAVAAGVLLFEAARVRSDPPPGFR